MKRSCLSLLLAVLVLIVVFLAVASYTGNLTIWEDGAFRLFDLTGCLPGGICN